MLDWFTTIPGILIICGVILLVIAIILFVVGTKKSKKEEEANTQSTDEKIVESISTMETVANPIPVEPVTVESVNPSVDITTVNTEESISATESVQFSEPAPVENVTTDIMNEQTITEIPNIISEQPIVDAPVMDMATEPEISPIEDNNSNVYGGEIPTVNFSINEEKPVTIYGGNDPLEATQTLPKVEEHHEPYGGVYPEARIVDQVQSFEVPTPVEETVSAMPNFEQVVDIPVPEPVVEMPVVEPVVEPTPIEITEPVATSEVEVPSTVMETMPTMESVQDEVKPIVEEL